jgi:hypothetical protein
MRRMTIHASGWIFICRNHPSLAKNFRCSFSFTAGRGSRGTDPSLPVPRPANDATREKQIPF